MLDKFPLSIKDFKGINIPDEENTAIKIFPNTGLDVVPSAADGEAFEAQNIRFLRSGGFRTRQGYGSGSSFQMQHDFAANEEIVRVHEVKELLGSVQNGKFLVLTYDGSTGRIYYTTGTSPAPILTIANMTDAFFLNAFGRVYISPWGSYGGGLLNEKVYVFTGAYDARPAQGAPLDRTAAVATAVANSATAGNVTPGTHLFDVVYETDTGWITSMYGARPATPGGTPVTQPMSLVCNGNQVTVSNIKTGAAGSGIIKRHIIMSKLVVNYDNTGWIGYEPFFAYTIEDNTTTTITFDKPDAGLVESANYLLDNTEGFIRSCTTMSLYNNRLCFYRPRSGTDIPEAIHSLLVSPVGDPERVDSYGTDNSRILIGREFSSSLVNNGFEYRGVNYVCKERATFAFREELDKDPSEWAVSLVDSSIGAYVLGISVVNDAVSHVFSDTVLVGGPNGIFSFNGMFEEIPITMGWWNSIVFANRKFCEIRIDSNGKLIYVLTGDPSYPRSGTATFSMMVGDYSRGASYGSIRWSKDILTLSQYTFLDVNYSFQTLPGKFFLTSILNNNQPYTIPGFTLKVVNVGVNNDQFNFVSEALSGPGSLEIPYDIKYNFGYTPNEIGDLYTFTGVRLRLLAAKYKFAGSTLTLVDNGSITLSYNILDGVSPITFESNLSPGLAPGKYFFEGFNAVGEKIVINISSSGSNGTTIDTNYFTRLELHEATIFIAERGKNRAL